MRLHAALLDWQEMLLDSLLPKRLSFADIHDSNWAVPMLVGWDDTPIPRQASSNGTGHACREL